MRRTRTQSRMVTHARADTYELAGDALEGKLSVFRWPGVHPCNDLVYAPTAKQRIPKTGAWIMVTRQLPPMERRLDEHARVGRVFWAEHVGGADDYGFTPDGTYKAVLRATEGDLTVFPYEYSRIEATALTELWAAGELVFHALNIEPGRLNTITFYARSRGIAFADAVVMALGTVSGPVGWFEPRADLAPLMEEMAAMDIGGPLTEKNHARRRAAAARRTEQA